MAGPTKNLLFLSLLYLRVSNAHITLLTPTPFNVGANAPVSDPLKADGSNFPCQLTADKPLSATNTTEVTVGTPIPLQFSGSANHGGGSCQIAITTDKLPTKESIWKVVHSIEGGCPTPDSVASPFAFTLPPETPNGDIAMAWTWMNRIGNREFYMNCAPLLVKGGANDAAGLDALPDLFIANIAPNAGCKVPETTDVVFPDPGKSVQRATSDFKPSWDLAAVPAACGATVGERPSPDTPSSGDTPSPIPAPSAGSPGAAIPTQKAPAAGNKGLYTPGPGEAAFKAPAPAPTQIAASPDADSDAPADTPADAPLESPRVTAIPASEVLARPSGLIAPPSALQSAISTPPISNAIETPTLISPPSAAQPTDSAEIPDAEIPDAESPVDEGVPNPETPSADPPSLGPDTPVPETPENIVLLPVVVSACEGSGIVCDGADKYGICSQGKAVFMPIPFGGACEGGVVRFPSGEEGDGEAGQGGQVKRGVVWRA